MKSPSRLIALAVAKSVARFPASTRADLYEAVGTLSEDPEIAKTAKKTAQAIREAESAEIFFKTQAEK